MSRISVMERLQKHSKWISFTLFAFMLVFTVIERSQNLTRNGLTQDESTVLQFTSGLLKDGHPYLIRGESEVQMATYELVPYFIAPFVRLFGWSDYSVRFSSYLFSLATLLLIYWAGRQWFDNRIALWSSTLYVVSPWSIYWSANCFYPSQVQFFTLLSVFFLYRLLRNNETRVRDYYFVALSICITFLTWEASGLLFPVYGLMAILLCWRRWRLFFNLHAGLSGLIVVAVVFAQMIRRSLLKDSYLQMGSSRAEIASPQIAALQPSFNPYYYFENIFLAEQHIVLTAFFFLGLFFVQKSWSLRFTFSFVLLTVLFFTQLLPVQAIRYLYLVLPLFLLSVSASTFYIYDHFIVRENMKLLSTQIMGALSLLLILVLQLAITSDKLLQLDAPYIKTANGAWELDPSAAAVDARYVAKVLKREYRLGDVIIVGRGAFQVHLYSGLKGDYTLQEIASSVVVYEPQRANPHYSDKWIGSPVLQTLQQLEDVLNRHERVWFISAPSGFVANAFSDGTYNYIRQKMTLKAEGYHSALYLKNSSGWP